MGDRNVNLVNLQTGAVENAAPEQAQEQFLRGERGLVPGQTIPLAAPDGTIMDFAADKVHGAVTQGWRFAGSPEIKRAEAEARPVQAALEGTAHGLTAGASSLMLQALGDSGLEARSQTEAFRSGETAGMVGGLLLPGLGEAATAVRGAEAARVLAPAARLAAEAQATKAAGAAALAEAAGESATRQLVTRGAVDGAAFGAVGSMSEESLGNPEANAQSILAAGGMGALLGAGLGGGMGAVLGGSADLAKAGWRKAREAFLDADQVAAHLTTAGVEAEAGNPIVRKFTQLVREDLPAMAGYDKQAIRTVNSAQAQAWIREGEQTLQTSVRQTADAFDRVAQEQGALDQVLAVKPDLVREVSKTGNAASAVKTLDQITSGMRGQLAGIEALERAGRGVKTGAAEVGRALDEAENAVFKSAGVKRAEFPGMEDPHYLSRLHENYELPGKVAGETFAQLGRLHSVLDNAARKAPDEFRGMYREMADFASKSLEDSSIWGSGAATAHREMAGALRARDAAWEAIQKRLPVAEGRVDRGAIESLARDLRSVKGDDRLAALQQWHTAYANLADVAERHYVGGKNMAVRANVAIRDFDRTVEHLQQKQAVFNALNSLDRQHAQMSQHTSGAASWALGSVFGVKGLAAQALVGTISNPSRIARVRAATADMRQAVAESITASAKSMVHAVPLEKAPDMLIRGTSRATQAIIEAKNISEREEAYKDRVAELNRLTDPMAIQDHLNTATRDMADSIPAHATAAQAQATQALAYLQARVPQAAAPAAGGLAAMNRPLTPGASEMLKFGRIDHAVQAPLAVIHEAARTGQVDHAQVQVIRDLYPALAQQLTLQLHHELGQLGAGAPAARQRRVLEAFLGAEPGGAYLKRAQSVHAAANAGKPGPKPSASRSTGAGSSAASSQQSVTQKLESR
jgi:hypothetical protein